jgi:hypothetical protein
MTLDLTLVISNHAHMTAEMMRALDFFFGDDITWQIGYADHPETREICNQFVKDGILLKTGVYSFLLHPKYMDIPRLHAWLDEGRYIEQTIDAFIACRRSSLSMDKP